MQIDSVPLLALFVGTMVVVLLAIEAGYRLGNSARRRSEGEKESTASAMAGTILGLGAFMLAFTFGIVTERYDTRRGLVREDAIAIRTAWLRADFLPEADREEAVELLLAYVDARLDYVSERNLAPERVRALLVETEKLQARLWEMAVENARKDMNSDVAALYLESLNEMGGVHAARVAVGIQSRVPGEIWLVLYSVTILGMMAVGYQTGIAGSNRSLARPILALSFALVFVLIASLDHPESGVMIVTQQPLIDLRDAMTAALRSLG